MDDGLDRPILPYLPRQRAQEFGDCASCLMCWCCGGWWFICGIAAWFHECDVKALNNAGQFGPAHKKAEEASMCRSYGIACTVVATLMMILLR